MTVDHNLLLHLENLARIALTPPERQACLQGLQDVLALFDQLQSLPTQNVDPLPQPFALVNVQRDDVVLLSLPNDAVLANAPHAADGAFCVPHALPPA